MSDPTHSPAPAMLAALRLIAAMPKQGERCPDDEAYFQDWTDSGPETPLTALHYAIDTARTAIAASDGRSNG